MSEAALNLSPSAALAALFSSLGRGMLWVTIKAVRAPLTTTVCGLAAFGMVSATSNALYMQPVDHPAPFFTDKAMVTSSVPPSAPPVVVATPRPQNQIVQQRVIAPSAPVPAVPRAVAEITHDDVKLMQERLKAAGLYDDAADGFYGPKTASAIRSYEARAGLPETGALTPEILSRIVNQPQATAPSNLVGGAPTTRMVSVESVVQQMAREVAGSGEKLLTAANEAQKQLQTQIESVQPDPLTQIVQRVANASPAATSQPKSTSVAPGPGDKAYVQKVQRGLASLGFLHGEIDGVAGEGTARAIRNFEVYYNYKVTGAVTPELLDLLENAGAVL